MARRSNWISLAALTLCAIVVAPASAQQTYTPYPTPLPPIGGPPANVAPVFPYDSGWPRPELPMPRTTAPAAGGGQIANEGSTSGEIASEEIASGEIIGGDTPIAAATASWIEPDRWYSFGKVTGGFELGINGSAGNSEALSLKTGFNVKNKTDFDELGFDLTYTKATASGVETQHNALFNASYERTIAESKWNLFLKEFLEYDEFKAFDLRIAINGGIGYHVIKTDTTTWKTRFGAGASTEVGGPTGDWVPEGVFGTDFERQLTKRQKISFTTDYFPDWSDFENYRVVTKASYEVLLDEEHNLNLKLSINDRYDSTPNGLKPNDINYSILLLWKM